MLLKIIKEYHKPYRRKYPKKKKKKNIHNR